MASLEDMLEPGERVIARDPEATVMWFTRLSVAVMIGAVVWFALDGDVILALLMAGGTALLILPDILKPSRGLYRWQAAITDRRLVYRSDNGAGYVTIPMTDIEILEPRDPEELFADPSEEARKIVKLLGKSRIRASMGDSIAVRHGARIFSFPVNKRGANRIRAAIEAARGEA